ncbi:hypothetical protein FRC02_010321 [Tulasnella sp. 418]|nr:hypothetical protein FRC02_010321 [Tulasnella sp. 418]
MYLQTSSGDILRDSPESGTYIIRSGSSTLSLNIICRSPGEKPLICLWDAVRSTTQRWCIECRGADYVIWNATTGHFLSFDVETGLSRTSTMTELSDDSSIAPSAVVQLPTVDVGGASSKKLKITGSQHPILWSIKRVGSSFHIKLASDQELALDADGFCEKNGSQLVACNDFHELESSTLAQYLLGSIPSKY